MDGIDDDERHESGDDEDLVLPTQASDTHRSIRSDQNENGNRENRFPATGELGDFDPASEANDVSKEHDSDYADFVDSNSQATRGDKSGRQLSPKRFPISPYHNGARTPDRRGELSSIPSRIIHQLSSPLSTPDRKGSSQKSISSQGSGFQDSGRGQTFEVTDTESGNEPNPGMGDENSVLIFGTSINLIHQMGLFQTFIKEFKLPGQDQPYYLAVLDEIHESQEMNCNVDCTHFQNHSNESRELYDNLVKFPTEMVPVLDLVLHQEFRRRFGDDGLVDNRRIQVRTFNLHKTTSMRALNPEDLEQLVAVRGMIVRTSTIIPDMKLAHFRCTICGGESEVEIDRGVIAEPKKCERCGKRCSTELVHNRSIFSDKQLIKVQEAPENVPEGETPHTITVFAYDSLVDVAKSGDRVEVTGIYKAMATRKNTSRRVLGSTFRTYLDVLHLRVMVKGEQRQQQRLDNAGDSSDFSNLTKAEKIEKFKAMAKDPNVYEKLAQSVAPSIWEHGDIKKGVLLQLIGGTNKEEEEEQYSQSKTFHRTCTRAEINILLCGDPGTSKSQLLSYVHKLTPRGIYTSGKGSSAVGLTAYVTRDRDTREIVLESGALVLSDRGICCIDEFDKMSDKTRAILHEVMEQQTISVAKAGIIATLNARTSILASANPKESRYNPYRSIVDNIDLPPTLISRFDLIYLVLDRPDESNDRRLAKHLVQLYYADRPPGPVTYDSRVLTEYIAYARRNCLPQLADSAVRKLMNGYVEMRQLGAISGGRKTISATTRQLESLIRLSEAHAKVRLSDSVDECDVDEALRLMHVATQKSAIDPRTGTIDMDSITTGISSEERLRNEKSAAELLQFLKQTYDPVASVRVFQLEKDLREKGMTTGDALNSILKYLCEQGSLKMKQGVISICAN